MLQTVTLILFSVAHTAVFLSFDNNFYQNVNHNYTTKHTKIAINNSMRYLLIYILGYQTFIFIQPIILLLCTKTLKNFSPKLSSYYNTKTD